MFSTTVIWVKANKTDLQTLHRQKRNWILPPKRLFENVNYTNEKFIAKIRSDEETRTNIVYSLLGPAVDKGLFTVDKNKGLVKIHGILDRETQAFYELKGRATLPDGTLVENDLDLEIIVLDQNDNAPEFELKMIGSVEELSDKDTMVFTVTAMDKDQEGTTYSKITYKVIQQDPAGEMMFKISRTSGEIKVSMNTLDREKRETYKLLITATDMDGADSDPNNRPMTGTGTVTINILDYEGIVEENIKNKEVIRIKTIDKDKEYTENWEAVYTIISGNEAGYFNITTDPKTNEGILMVTKELNYEEFEEISLKLVVNNKAAYHKSVVNDKIIEYPIKIKVKNVREAPHFQPAVKVIRVSEDRKDLTKVITTYTATDSDTLLTASNVRYLKGEDVDHWVTIDEQTGEIRLIKYPDYESEIVKNNNGIYYIKILALTEDFPPKTVTGTLAIHVEDINDNAPILDSSSVNLCYGNSGVNVTATDADGPSNAAPFDFILSSKGTKENWSFEDVNDTTKTLRSHEILWPGQYTVELEVKDQQKKSSGVQKLQVLVLMCTETKAAQSTVTVLRAKGVQGILLGILLLLAIPMLLLVCKCGPGLGTNLAFPFEPEQQLITYNTEGQGEDKELELMAQLPVNIEGGSSGKLGAGWEAHEDWRKYGWESQEEYINNQWHVKHADSVDFKATGIKRHSDFFTESTREHFTLDSMALSESFLSNYYATKTWKIMNQETNTNELLVSSYEDCISVTSSFDDFSGYLHEENNLDFLDDLGPNFTRLAEICCGSAVKLEVSSTPTPAKTISSSSQEGIKVEGALHAVNNEATSVSASSSSSTTQITTSNYTENISSGSVTSAATVGQTLFAQQPTVYLSSTPMYVMEQQHQHQPGLLLASGPILGVPERNVVLVEKGAMNMAVTAQNTLPSLGLQQANTRVMVDPGNGGTVVHGFLGNSEPQSTAFGTFHVMESQQVESMEPVHVVQSSSHSSISKSQSMQAKGQSGVIMA
ncbi:hypothetical protein KOW79_006741 [Hemibagrus wyckioides]|uniref:Cadherin domain-containing protein n=1 Tax=Hemibagrus wyckioides TaxID=337641 RepID=A0A9D3NXU9_9TELE|nr:hypothetical protein KOW79_006741 [Hemibagrus wyckioides]